MSVLAPADKAIVDVALARSRAAAPERPPAPPAPAAPARRNHVRALPELRSKRCPWCGWPFRSLAPACAGCIDLEAALQEGA